MAASPSAQYIWNTVSLPYATSGCPDVATLNCTSELLASAALGRHTIFHHTRSHAPRYTQTLQKQSHSVAAAHTCAAPPSLSSPLNPCLCAAAACAHLASAGVPPVSPSPPPQDELKITITPTSLTLKPTKPSQKKSGKVQVTFDNLNLEGGDDIMPVRPSLKLALANSLKPLISCTASVINLDAEAASVTCSLKSTAKVTKQASGAVTVRVAGRTPKATFKVTVKP